MKTELLKGTKLSNSTFQAIRRQVLKIKAKVRVVKARVKLESDTRMPLKKMLMNILSILSQAKSPG